MLSIADPANPVFRVEDSEGKVDLSDRFLPARGLSGDMYPYRKADGAPILPVSLYHAKRTGRLWDPWTGAELVDGTLTVAGLWTMWRHMVRDASWPQRWALNAGVEGLEPNRETGDMAVDLDPAALLNFRAKMPGQASSIGQFDPGGDPESLGQAIRQYSADLLQDFDLSPADIARTNSDARSGHAIEITRDGQRSAQRRMEPQFRRGDETTLSVIAILWNRATGAELPEDGWGIKYLGLPLSMQERKLVLEDHAQRAALKIASRVDLLAAVEGITLDQARRRLLVIELDEAAFPGINSAGPSGSTAPTPNKDSGGSNRPEPDHG